MKNLTNLAGLCLLLGIIYSSCKEQPNEKMDVMYVIGVDPCTSNFEAESLNKGYIIYLEKTSDTVVTYNLPLAIQRQINNKKIERGIFFPPENIIKIDLSYKVATEEEKVLQWCFANIDTSEISKLSKKQIIILNSVIEL